MYFYCHERVRGGGVVYLSGELVLFGFDVQCAPVGWSEGLAYPCVIALKVYKILHWRFALGFVGLWNREFQLVHELCQYVLSMSQRPELIRATLSTLHAFLSWIPLGYIFESALVRYLTQVTESNVKTYNQDFLSPGLHRFFTCMLHSHSIAKTACCTSMLILW